MLSSYLYAHTAGLSDDVRLRLTYDAAVAKVDKLTNAKKVQEKDREDAEEELETAKAR